jgi:ribosome recycling factor
MAKVTLQKFLKDKYMDKKQLLADVTSRMEASINSFDSNLRGLRVGRASSNFLDPVQVEIYGSKQPIGQLATISTPEARTISIQVWDKSCVKQVEKGIIDANLGLNPLIDGQLIRINIPPLSQERRKELVKIGAKYCEDAKVAIRNIRRDVLDLLKKSEKDSLISEDDLYALNEQVQKITDEAINKVDKTFVAKEKEILSI